MDSVKKEAYAFLLSTAMLHLKWELVGSLNGLNWWPPWRLPEETRKIKRSAYRAVVFHNLAISLTHDMNGFNEETFWREIDEFLQRFPEAGWTNYRGMFERKLAGEDVMVIKPGG
jgi:hypothetical protein